MHPDLCVLLPDALHLTLGWRQKTDEPESTDSKKKPSEWISVDQVRSAIEFSTLTRGRGRLKVVVIHPAERMPQIAASALLKLLEEPQGGQRFVLACGDVAALLPTDRRYFTYMGSLTTPPCSEGVLWMVMKQPVTISPEQIGIFARLYPMNARPIQSAAGRLIKESN